MRISHHLQELTSSPYYRFKPIEALGYTYAKWLFARNRVDGPREFLARLGMDPEAALNGFAKWQALFERMLDDVACREGVQGGVSLEDGMMLYALIRLAQPEFLVETGVAAGVSNAFISAALIDNGKGTLYSIELPPSEVNAQLLADGTNYSWGATGVGWAVPEQIRQAAAERRHLILRDVRLALPELLAQLPALDGFFHDDLHTPDHMLWEYELVWPVLRNGGLLISDDADFGWVRFCRNHKLDHSALLNMQRLTVLVKN